MQDMETILNKRNVNLVDFIRHFTKRDYGHDLHVCACVGWVGATGRGGGNHLDDRGPNLLVSSDLVNRAESVRTQMNGFLSNDCI